MEFTNESLSLLNSEIRELIEFRDRIAEECSKRRQEIEKNGDFFTWLKLPEERELYRKQAILCVEKEKELKLEEIRKEVKELLNEVL